jgi:beta-glucanase (GH16 family)
MKLLFLCVVIGYASAQTLVWSDEFNGPAGQAPDGSKWGRDVGGGGFGNNEHQFYTDSTSNAALDGNGNLVITARRENPNNYQCWYGYCQYTSARMLTDGKFSHTYGTMEARIKISIGQGFWPAFWMLGDNYATVGWPQCGEIDIMENVGNDPLYVHGSLHGPGYSGGNGLTSSFRSPNGQAFANDFHIYRVVWTPTSITWSVDGVNYATKTPADAPGQWVFNHGFFFILNLAVGGDWPGYPDASSVFPQTMVVDYVRAYSLDSSGGSNRIISSVGGRCLDVAGANNANGTPIQVVTCNGNAAQDWTIGSDQSIRALGKCLDVDSASTTNGANVQIYDCNNSAAQHWVVTAAGDIVSINADKCLDIREPSNQDGARLQIWECSGNANQKWTVV